MHSTAVWCVDQNSEIKKKINNITIFYVSELISVLFAILKVNRTKFDYQVANESNAYGVYEGHSTRKWQENYVNV